MHDFSVHAFLLFYQLMKYLNYDRVDGERCESQGKMGFICTQGFCEICKEEVSAGNRPEAYLNATGEIMRGSSSKTDGTS